jgi:hypothetical protein
MRKAISVAVAALTLVTSTTASAGDRWRRHHHDDHDGEKVAIAAVAGLVGLAIGAAVMSSSRDKARPVDVATGPEPLQPDRQNIPWYGPYSAGADGCFVERWVYDPAQDRQVRERKAVWCEEPPAADAPAS